MSFDHPHEVSNMDNFLGVAFPLIQISSLFGEINPDEVMSHNSPMHSAIFTAGNKALS